VTDFELFARSEPKSAGEMVEQLEEFTKAVGVGNPPKCWIEKLKVDVARQRYLETGACERILHQVGDHFDRDHCGLWVHLETRLVGSHCEFPRRNERGIEEVQLAKSAGALADYCHHFYCDCRSWRFHGGVRLCLAEDHPGIAVNSLSLNHCNPLNTDPIDA